MNDHRLSRLKRLAAGAALVSATVANAGEPPTKASPAPAEPLYVNSVDAPAPDAGVVAEPKAPNVNSPPRVNSPPPVKPVKLEPKHVNSPKPKTK